MMTLPAVAVRVAVCEVETAATDAENVADEEPEAIITEVGTVTELLLLERLTAMPPVGAAAVKLTVHALVAAPVMDPLAHVKLPSAVGLTPAPLMLSVRLPLEELLAMLMVPV